MEWSCFPFIRPGQNHLARHSERGKKTRQKEEEVGRQNEGMDRPGVRQVPEGSGEQGKMEKTGCKIICRAPMTLAITGLMIMMMKEKEDVIWLDRRRADMNSLWGSAHSLRKVNHSIRCSVSHSLRDPPPFFFCVCFFLFCFCLFVL